MQGEVETVRRVVGVSYEPGELAPIVVLKGAGESAAAVLDAARRSAEPPRVVRDAALVDQLYRIPIDAPVGRELFPVMATLLAHVVQLDQHMQNKQAGDK